MDAQSIILALAVGLVLGAVFAGLRLPVPAPDKIEGIAGIIGIFAGMLLVKQFTP